MTTIAVFADPPEPGTVLGGLVENGPLTDAEAADLYAALLRDACDAVERSGGDLLVNYRTPADWTDEDAREAVESAVAPALDSPGAVRYEVQVGSTRSARVGNTIAHLLDTEGVRTAGALDPRGAFVARRHLDEASMKLRGATAVFGPSQGGRVWYAAFSDPVDFTDAYARPALTTLVDRARDDGGDVDFLERLPVVESPADLASLVVELRARTRAEKPVPVYTAEVVADLGLDAVDDGDRGVDVVREGTDSS